MSIDFSNFWVIGVIVLLAEGVTVTAGWAIFIHRIKTKAPHSAPKYWGLNPDDRKWEKEAAELTHTELSGVRDSAKNWAGSIAALLGIGGTVAFVKGEDAFAKLTVHQGNYAFWLTLTAALLAGLAIGFATFAAQGTPARYKSIDGWTLRQISRSGSLLAMRRLLWSKVLAIVAAVAVLATAGISWKGSIATEKSPTVHAIVTTEDGTLHCGELTTAAAGDVLVTSGEDELAVDGASEVTMVDSCPPAP